MEIPSENWLHQSHMVALYGAIYDLIDDLVRTVKGHDYSGWKTNAANTPEKKNVLCFELLNCGYLGLIAAFQMDHFDGTYYRQLFVFSCRRKPPPHINLSCTV